MAHYRLLRLLVLLQVVGRLSFFLHRQSSKVSCFQASCGFRHFVEGQLCLLCLQQEDEQDDGSAFPKAQRAAFTNHDAWALDASSDYCSGAHPSWQSLAKRLL